MAERVVLHVGTMKSGTSFLQNVLAHNSESLLEQGVLFPGGRWRAQVAAVQDLIRSGGKNQPPLDDNGPWHRLAREIHAHQGTAVISMEFLGPRNLQQISRIVETFPDSRIEAVITCRDLARNIPAMWLESTQNGGTTGWADYLTAVRTEDRTTPAGRNFWRHQAVPTVAERWTTGLGPDRVTLVTVPRPGADRGLLWERIASVIGIDPAACDLDVRANPSIGLATAEVLLRLNRRMLQDDGTMPSTYDKYVKHILAKRGLVSRQSAEPRLGLDESWVIKRGRAQVADLRDGDYRVVGDLDELLPEGVKGVHADQVGLEDQLDAAVDGIIHLIELFSDAEQQHRRAERERKRAAASERAGSAT